jgi:competence protein ComEA
MTTIQNLIRCRSLRASLTALGLAAALATFAPTGASAQRSHRAHVEQSQDGVVNIQTATSDQLQLLPGVGPSKAQAIVAFREHRAFRRIEDIMRVRGIGRATFRRLRPMITVDGPTTLDAPVHTPRASESHDQDSDE